jgi:ubiquinone/menaquinone biosynthesis C-methylase UbiE
MDEIESERQERLAELARQTQEVAQRWAHTPYYDDAEAKARSQYERIILPFLGGAEIDMSHVLELAVGHGRMTEILLTHAQRVTGLDILQENIDFCNARFTGHSNLKLMKNDGVKLQNIPDREVSFVFCFDSMIHFDSDVVRSYLGEFFRIMKPGALAFLHHSNLTRNPGGNFQRNAHARNFMSIQMFSHYSQKEGLQVVKQKVIDWGTGEKQVENLDGLTLLRRAD